VAHIEDKIAEIKDQELRQAIAEEVKALKEKKKFGLVFEAHQPEVVPVFRVPIKVGATVAKKTGNLGETYRVKKVYDGQAELVKDIDDKQEKLPIEALTVVRRVGEPIYPALIPMGVVTNDNTNKPYHILIEADNFHALQLLGYLYSGKVDCIYIDPPYNTGAQDWKYNNDYVDKNDSWRHSKWLSMMRKRLILGKHLLRRDGTLIIAIDDNELAHLICLLEEIYPDYELTIVTVVHNPRGNITKNFAQTNEYAVFVTPKGLSTVARTTVENSTPRKLRRWGHNSTREARRSMFYPIYIKDGKVTRIGEVPSDDFHPESRNIEVDNGEIEIWPIDQNGIERRWNFGLDSIGSHLDRIVALPKDGGLDLFLAEELSPPKTVWVAPELDAGGAYGSSLVEMIVKNKFPYPKSLYTVLRSIEPVLKYRKNAIIVDFFAGSGTTLNAINLMNAADNGQRQCIMVTNNEVSVNEAQILTTQGLHPGDADWEKHGICRSVTYPRSKFVIQGKRDDETPLPGEYITGRTVTKEKLRSIKQLGFTEGQVLSLSQRKQLVALIPTVPQSKIVANSPWFLDDEISKSILWDVIQIESYFKAIENADHVTEFFIVTQDNKVFNRIKEQIPNILGPVLEEENETRPLSLGFSENLAYFKIDFLEPTEVAIGRQFEAILPILWIMAGGKGICPQVVDPRLPWLTPEDCPFAILIQETHFYEFRRRIEGRKNLIYVFLVTNSESAYHDMQAELPKEIIVVQLYKNYLENFKINTQSV
jgi:adenine-specific DNA-methyltransferase